MKVLLIGSGAREHAIAWKLRQTLDKDDLYIAPGNPGTAELGTNLAISADDLDGLQQAAVDNSIDFTIVGPEGPLEKGLVDAFTAMGHLIFGPTKAAARVETSKAFAKELMLRYHIPTAWATAHTDSDSAKVAISATNLPVVIKADGLAAGKGVVVCHTQEDAFQVVDDYLESKTLGEAGATVLVENFLDGREVSVFGFTDGRNISRLVAACDYKRLGDGDVGPNTGGMGSYSPPSYWDCNLEKAVMESIMVPIVNALRESGSEYRGILYAGLMLTDKGPQVVEFNCRFGDPETQVLMPRMESDLLPIMLACANGDITGVDVLWTSDAAVGVVLASEGYPGNYTVGHPIGRDHALHETTLVLHAGTGLRSSGLGTDELVTSGGRVMTVVGRSHDLSSARVLAYTAVEQIDFSGKQYRKDIAEFLNY